MELLNKVTEVEIVWYLWFDLCAGPGKQVGLYYGVGPVGTAANRKTSL